MTTTTTPAAYLYALPEPIQERLVEIARSVIGLSQTEKEHAHAMLSGYVLTIAALGSPEEAQAGRMVADLDGLLRAAYNQVEDAKEATA